MSASVGASTNWKLTCNRQSDTSVTRTLHRSPTISSIISAKAVTQHQPFDAGSAAARFDQREHQLVYRS